LTITLLVVSSKAFNCSRRFWPEVAREVLAREGGVGCAGGGGGGGGVILRATTIATQIRTRTYYLLCHTPFLILEILFCLMFNFVIKIYLVIFIYFLHNFKVVCYSRI